MCVARFNETYNSQNAIVKLFSSCVEIVSFPHTFSRHTSTIYPQGGWW